MRNISLFIPLLLVTVLPIIASAQTDSGTTRKDTTTKSKIDTAIKSAADTSAVAIAAVDTAMVTTPMNCYKQWLDNFSQLGTKPMTDGTHEVVIAFKNKESCHYFMGRVEVAGGKIKAPLFVQTQGGEYKTFTELGNKLDAEFLAVTGDGLWNISNGMSVVFRTANQEYGRVFFYKSLNKDNQMSKEAPSPADLLKN